MSVVVGALLMAIFIAPVVGVKSVVPTVGIATLIAHVARVWVYRDSIVWRPALLMLLGAIPATIASARLYVALPADVIAVVLGLFLLASVRCAGSREDARCASGRARSARSARPTGSSPARRSAATSW